jgi:transposase
MSAKEALTLYKSRDVSEKLFCSDKSFLGNRTMRAATDSTVDAKIFVGFVALIVRARIYTLLRKRVMEMTKKPNFMTVPAALKELDKIELIRQAGGNYKLDHAITATQKTILGAFGIDESDMLVRIAALGKELMNAEKPEKETENDGTYEID